LFEITEDGEKQVLSRGGKGGLGNWHFRCYKPNSRYAQPGLPGSEMDAILELNFSRCRFSRLVLENQHYCLFTSAKLLITRLQL
jgi:hypothetical protein